ncbi:MAG: 3',5'-cyclic-AMP phosphodiesterase [Proteobacteria bacterium]|nr:MAG: 3',5'-cyclic-AMP phosphodiesterase [Pseudomonadota bacterium]
MPEKAKPEKAKPEKIVQVVQITDSHLRREPDGKLLGVNTRDSFDAVLELVRANHPSPDIVLATGDIAQDGEAAAYHCFREKTAFFDCPVCCIAGNHDDADTMERVLGGGKSLSRQVRIGNWQLVMLNSSVKGQVFGEIGSSDLALLERALDDSSGLNCLVCFHHQPIDIQCQWLDAIGLHNRDRLFDILGQYDHVRAVLWGHIHQELDQIIDNIRYLATPSTCVQFAPKTRDFTVDDQAPGYRWLELHPGGDIHSGVIRVESRDFGVDRNSRGY